MHFIKHFTLIIGLTLFYMGCHSSNQNENWKQNKASKQTGTPLYQYGIDTARNVPTGLKTGDKAPTFNAVTQQGESLQLNTLLNKGPVVLMFYRGQWCPVCNQYLQGFEDSLQLIRNQGARIIAVTPETPANARKMREKSGTSLPIISDTSETIIRQYEVSFHVSGDYARKIERGFDVSIAANNGDKKARLPVPATYIINSEGYITWRFFNPNYKQRASVKQIVEALARM